MSDAKHTPTPWGLEGGTNKKGDLFIWKTQPPEVIEGHAIATVLGWQPTVKANAAFIVRACNNHDNLIAQIEYALHWLDDHKGPGCAIAALRKALADATK